MLSILSLIICIVALMFTFASYAKVKNVSEENIRINKNSLELKAIISTMSNNIENLKNSQKDLLIFGFCSLYLSNYLSSNSVTLSSYVRTTPIIVESTTGAFFL